MAGIDGNMTRPIYSLPDGQAFLSGDRAIYWRRYRRPGWWGLARDPQAPPVPFRSLDHALRWLAQV